MFFLLQIFAHIPNEKLFRIICHVQMFFLCWSVYVKKTKPDQLFSKIVRRNIFIALFHLIKMSQSQNYVFKCRVNVKTNSCWRICSFCGEHEQVDYEVFFSNDFPLNSYASVSKTCFDYTFILINSCVAFFFFFFFFFF